MSLNSVNLIGRLTKDPDLRYTPNGKAVTNFTLAINRIVSQEGQPNADFINCVVWGKSAENLAEYQKKGSQIGVEGSLQSRSYENNQGQRVFVTEVLANRIHFLEPAKKNGNGQGQNQQQRFQQGGQQQGFQQGFPPNNQQQGFQQQGTPYQNDGQGGYPPNNQQQGFQQGGQQRQGQTEPFGPNDDLPFF